MTELKTELGDYILWYDGVIEVDPQEIEGLFLRGVDPRKVAVTELSPDIQKYNRLARDKIKTKDEVDPDLIDFSWNIPKAFLEIDIPQYIKDICKTKLAKYSGDALRVRLDRVDRELREYTSRNLLDVLKVLIYTIDTFKKNNVVWGVGRGSSCASYILFLLEVHSVDPIKYDIPLEEFFKS
jgi:DNA polymerase III alpha subunit